jgi:glycosyltransferase involved in cell wall biosynthesis
MTTNPLVSVVITFYNTPLSFFGEAIESVLQQSYRDWELLLVDDGSSGDSTNLARQYAETHPARIYYLEHEGHENRGKSASRQLGIDKAQGEYIAFLDSDDVWLPNKLEEQVAILEGYPEAGMLYGNTLYWFSWASATGVMGRDSLPRLGLKPNSLVRPPELLPLFLRGHAAVPCTCSILVRRRTIELTGGFEHRFTQLYEDQVFYSKVCLEVPVYVSDRCWDKYRQHPDSSCARAAGTTEERAARVAFLQWLEGYLAERGQCTGAVWEAVQEELWSVNLRPVVRRLLKPLRPFIRPIKGTGGLRWGNTRLALRRGASEKERV